jgi:hypothetical protein
VDDSIDINCVCAAFSVAQAAMAQKHMRVTRFIAWRAIDQTLAVIGGAQDFGGSV